ncbi:MAG: class I SAM-dependent methyltransferase [Firmicutes bacterium]|nr:class I SAM-dependent methyltransferase [Bacillota bacterium]
MKKHLPVGSRVLDVGCGDGWLAEILSQYEWHGVEPDPVLREKAMAKGMKAVPGRAEILPFPDGFFDAICMFDVLEHLKDDNAAMGEAKRVLKRGGLLFASVPLHPELWSEHDARCGHYRRYRKGEVAELLRQNGFTVDARRFFVSVLLPLVWLVRKMGCKLTRLPVALDTVAEKFVQFDYALGLSFGLTELVAAHVLL